MLERITDLPAELIGLRAKGKVSREDYEQVVLPHLEEARREGRRIRFLYVFGPEFEGFTASAAWEDLRVGLRYLRLFERCAVVSDVEWIRTASRALGALMPCPLKVFAEGEQREAADWLLTPVEPSLDYRILPDRKVLVVEPQHKLRSEDFDAVETNVDAWLEGSGETLEGLVVHAEKFPGWEDLGSALRHFRFVRDHHQKIQRIAWAVDSKVAAIAPTLAQHFTDAEVKRFDTDDLAGAIAWASGEGRAGQPGRQARA